MSKGRGKIDPEKDGLETRFQKGQSGNPWGRPPRLVSQIIRDMKDDGLEAVTASQVSDVISVLLNYTAEQVRIIASDKSLPILIQRTARRFAGAPDKEWDSLIEKALDRAHGKPKQGVDLTSNGKDIGQSPLSGLSVEKQAQYLRLLIADNAANP